MLSKNELKYIQSLCQKKQRQTEGLFIAEGTKIAEELESAKFRVRKLYALASWAEQYSGNAEVIKVTEAELTKISQLQTPNQVLAIVEQKKWVTPTAFSTGLTLVLDGLQDPGNMGTLIRIADWFGIKQVMASLDTVELYNPKVIQSTMGSFTRVEVSYVSLAPMLAKTNLPVYGALLEGKPIYSLQPVQEGILVIGNESKGIREALLPHITQPITIPRIGGAESLNAAVAAGILLSHLLKS